MLRGVESGFSIARAARGGGISFVSDRFGRVLSERRSEVALGVLESEVPISSEEPTIYASIGDLFGGICVIAWVVLIAVRLGAFTALAARERP